MASCDNGPAASSSTAVAPINLLERAVPEVPPPCWEPLDKCMVWDYQGKPHLENLNAHFLKEGRLSPEDAIQIAQQATFLLKKEPNLLTLQDPITVCGDIHGQYYDLVKLFEIGGPPGSGQYLFLGDYVDRGCFSCECALYLLAVKIHFPDTFLMLRGNHECRHLTAYFNFKQECRYKYSLQVYEAFMACFDSLPLAATLNGRFLCVHGGLSPDIQTLSDIMQINRFREPPPSGPMCDLIWSDPMDEEEEEASPDALYLHNDLRGCSYVFSYNAVCQFLKNNSLLSIIRAHEAQDEGYRLYKKNVLTGFPSVICVFSAPNYCDAYNNKAAIIRFHHNVMNIKQFSSSPHPYYLPNFMNVFTWSLPFVVEKVSDFLLSVWHLVDDDLEEAETASGGAAAEDAEQVRSKILAMGKVARMYKTMRPESDSPLPIKGISPAKAVLPASLAQLVDAKRPEDFETSKRADSVNERRPEFGG
jgi:serine/threonine-protein phosphatase 2B catalytic subunit